MQKGIHWEINACPSKQAQPQERKSICFGGFRRDYEDAMNKSRGSYTFKIVLYDIPASAELVIMVKAPA